MQTRPRKLLDRVREMIRLKHYSYRTEKSYTNRIERYIDSKIHILVNRLLV